MCPFNIGGFDEDTGVRAQILKSALVPSKNVGDSLEDPILVGYTGSHALLIT